MAKIKKLGIFSFAKFQAVLSALLALVPGYFIPLAVFGLGY